MNFKKSEEEDCEEPVCFSNPDSVKKFYKSDKFQNLLLDMSEEKNIKNQNKKKTNKNKNEPIKNKNLLLKNDNENKKDEKNIDCLLTRELLGHFSWSLLL